MNGRIATSIILSNVPVHFVGDPGCGKTRWVNALWKGIAKAYGYPVDNFQDKLLSQIDPTDLGGFPMRDGEVVKRLPLAWLDRLCKEPGMLFLDEFSLAPRQTMASGLTLIQDRKAGDMTLHPKTLVVLASNPSQFTGVELMPQSANRMAHIPFSSVVSLSDWTDGLRGGFPVPTVDALPKDWTDLIPTNMAMLAAYAEKMGSEVFRMPNDNPEALGGAWPSRRSWTNAMVASAACQSQGLDDGTAIGSIVGDGAALAFVSWRANQDLGDPVEALKDVKNYPLPARDDALYILLTACASIAIQKEAKVWEACWTLLERAANNKKADIATVAARTLAGSIPKGATIPPSTKSLLPLLTAARKAEGR